MLRGLRTGGQRGVMPWAAVPRSGLPTARSVANTTPAPKPPNRSLPSSSCSCSSPSSFPSENLCTAVAVPAWTHPTGSTARAMAWAAHLVQKYSSSRGALCFVLRFLYAHSSLSCLPLSRSIIAAQPITIFETMSIMAAKHGAINLGQGFPGTLDRCSLWFWRCL